jgi:hypothetical protein
MMSQQRAAERQATVQQQQMDMQRASAAREAELQPDRVKKAAYEALSSQQKAVLEFFDLAAEGVKQSRTPEDAVKIGQFLKSSFNSPELQNIVDQTLSSMPSDPALWPEWKKQTELQSLDSKDRLTEEFTTQNLGTSTRIVATPKYGGGVARVVPGSEVDLGQEVTYVRGGDGSVRAMPKRLPVGGGGGGLVGGVRGGGAAGGVQMGQPIAGTGKPAAAAAKPGKTTESERRFGTIAQQMGSNLSEAVRVLTDNPEVIRPTTAEYAASQIPFYGEEARLFAESEARQQFVPAVLRFLDNITFVNTGAGTSKAQEENYRRSYVPTYQDTPGSAHRKLKNMVTFAKNVKSAAGSLWTPQMDADFAALETAVDKLKPPAAAAGAKTPAAKAPAATSTASGVKVSNW